MRLQPNSVFTALTVLVVLAALPLGGCMFGALQDNLDELEHHARISGAIDVEDWNESPVVIGLLRLGEIDGAPDHPVDKIELHGPGEYFFIVPPGQYRVVAYEDTNRNFQWDEDEHERIAAYNNFAPIPVQAGEMRGHVDIRITDRAIRNVPEIADEELERGTRGLSGTILPMESPRFGPDTGPRGLWHPVEFLDEPGWGLFLLGAYDPAKVPVLFVHGISGYPQEFASLVEGLDHGRFQPWVFHYPSGFELGMVATAMQRVLNDMRRQHGYDHMCLVAHSMGGVLSRLFLKNHPEDEGRFVHTFVTIDSPLGGMPSAAMGVSSAPVVVPSWRNLDPEGETIPTLYEIPLPAGLEYHLFFGHVDGQTDTVVSLASQLRPEAMAEAMDMQGFSNTHTGVLRSADTSRHLNAALARCGEAPASNAPVAGGETPPEGDSTDD
ncbi:MAG: alpha/beta fold hydrolase [Deltaproteobacteria bacterium]|nr:alpha/beta fold hydrolase [Deltaproteobacteria bacterium]